MQRCAEKDTNRNEKDNEFQGHDGGVSPHLQRHGRKAGPGAGAASFERLFHAAGGGAEVAVATAAEVLGVYVGDILLPASAQAAGQKRRTVQQQREEKYL